MKELKNGKLISTTDNSEIKVWIKKDNTIECEFILKNVGVSYDILEVRKNEVVALSGNNINFYDLNRREGKVKEYNDDGELEFERHYLNEERNGKGKKYNDDGQLKFEREYLNGKKLNGK